MFFHFYIARILQPISCQNLIFLFLFLKLTQISHLVGGFNPFQKYARQIGSSPQTIGVKIPKNIGVATTQS